MSPETVGLVLGPAGATVLLLYIAKLLWDAHQKEQAAKDARIAAQDAAIDKLAGAVEESTRLLREIRDRQRAEDRRRQ